MEVDAPLTVTSSIISYLDYLSLSTGLHDDYNLRPRRSAK